MCQAAQPKAPGLPPSVKVALFIAIVISLAVAALGAWVEDKDIIDRGFRWTVVFVCFLALGKPAISTWYRVISLRFASDPPATRREDEAVGRHEET